MALFVASAFVGNAGAQTDGVYYLYDAQNKVFLSRGAAYGTEAVTDKYGIPFNWNSANGSIEFLDWTGVYLFITGTAVYTDNASSGWAFTETEGGYYLQNKDKSVYTTHSIGDYGSYVHTTTDVNAATIWTLKTPTERDAILAAYPTENYSAMIAAAGLDITADNFEATLNGDNYARKDMTSSIGTATFAGNIGSWTWNQVRSQGNQPAYGTNFAEAWQATGSYTQKITNLPEGIYKLTVNAFQRQGSNANCATLSNNGYELSTAYLKGNDQQVQIASWATDRASDTNPNSPAEAIALFNNGKYHNEIYVYVGEEGTLDITLAKPTYVGNCWLLFNNFTLTYYTDQVSEEDATAIITKAKGLTGAMESTAASTLAETLAAFEAEATMANYNALFQAVTTAETSIASYATAKIAIEKALAIKDANNFVTSDAYTTFADAISNISNAYNDGSLSNADAANAGTTLGTSISGWRANANGAAGVYMVSAWDITTDSWDDAHVNTWSTEGETDGSNFSVPFVEYWVGSGNLAAKTMTATLEGLTPGQNYKVSMDVRVNGIANASNMITLTISGGSPIDITTGNQIGETGRYLGNFAAYGKADENGILTAKVEVLDGSGISWLCWQNVKYEEIDLDFSALSAAIANAETVNSKISGGVKLLTDAIAAANEVFSSATAQEELDAAVTPLTTATSEAETIIVARKNLAGVAKKANALSQFLDTDITAEITTATEYAANAEATATEADAKADAINAYFSAWKVVALNNANFDTDINISKDGTVNAEIISPATAEKPYIYPVTGWTQAFTFNNTASQGTTAAYGAITSSMNKGTNGTNPPAEDMFGKSEGGVLHLSSGWSDQARYKQTVTLPAGKYVLYYEGYNANNTTSSLNSNYFGIGGLTAGDLEETNNTFKYSDEKSFAYGEWKATAFDFTLTKNVAEAALNVGIIGGTAGSGSTPKMWFDNVTIYCIAEAATMSISDAQYSTFIAPFDVEIPEDVTASKITGVAENGSTLIEEAITGTIPANTPVLLYRESALTQTFYGQSTATADTYTEGLLTGVYVNTEVPVGSYVLLNKNNQVGFYEVVDAIPTVKPNRCYLTVTGSTAPMFSLERGEGTTSIEDAELTNEDVVIYDLAGRRVEKMEKGIYIVNGKKVIR